MGKSQFRFAYFTRDYETTLAFYRDGLELPVIETWDRHPDDRGALIQAGSGIIEVLSFPKSGEAPHLWDDRPPQGAFIVIEEDQLEARYQRAVEKGLLIKQELKDEDWGHRIFCVNDPNGLTICFFKEI